MGSAPTAALLFPPAAPSCGPAAQKTSGHSASFSWVGIKVFVRNERSQCPPLGPRTMANSFGQQILIEGPWFAVRRPWAGLGGQRVRAWCPASERWRRTGEKADKQITEREGGCVPRGDAAEGRVCQRLECRLLSAPEAGAGPGSQPQPRQGCVVSASQPRGWNGGDRGPASVAPLEGMGCRSSALRNAGRTRVKTRVTAVPARAQDGFLRCRRCAVVARGASASSA